ncbi:MAG: 30S ribosomal protein S8 [Cutibacterium granulosum]|nr:MAG: 30S ribosomal protein S8 [Cutibacterium granulosum]
MSALSRELGGMGVEVTELDDGLRIDPAPLQPSTFHTYADHRMVMAGAVLALRAPGTVIEDPATVGKTLTINLKYGPNRERSIAGVRRVSKPGLRVYAKANALPKVLGGLGIAIISTSKGLLTDRQAHEQSVGGEVLAYVW